MRVGRSRSTTYGTFEITQLEGTPKTLGRRMRWARAPLSDRKVTAHPSQLASTASTSLPAKALAPTKSASGKWSLQPRRSKAAAATAAGENESGTAKAKRRNDHVGEPVRSPDLRFALRRPLALTCVLSPSYGMIHTSPHTPGAGRRERECTAQRLSQLRKRPVFEVCRGLTTPARQTLEQQKLNL